MRCLFISFKARFIIDRTFALTAILGFLRFMSVQPSNCLNLQRNKLLVINSANKICNFLRTFSFCWRSYQRLIRENNKPDISFWLELCRIRHAKWLPIIIRASVVFCVKGMIFIFMRLTMRTCSPGFLTTFIFRWYICLNIQTFNYDLFFPIRVGTHSQWADFAFNKKTLTFLTRIFRLLRLMNN